MGDSLHLLALFTAKPGREADLRRLLEGLIDPTRAEAGCLDYRLMEDRENPRRFVFVEEWRSPEALDEHFATAHLQDALAKFPELIEGELEIRRLALVR